MKNKIIMLLSAFFVMLLFLNSGGSLADTIILRNGNRVVVDKAWEEGEYIRGSRIKNIIGFHKDSVENVIYDKIVDSFNFDMWTGGITINKAMEIAESYDLPINKVGVISSARKFNSSVYKQINSSDNFYYKTKLVDKNGEVTLCFTPASRLLYKVVVHLYGLGVNRKGTYRDEIEVMLTKKYGTPDKSKGLFEDRRNWNVNNQYAVNLVIGVAGIDIIYLDNALNKKKSYESKEKSNEEKSDNTTKDSGTIKFLKTEHQQQKGLAISAFSFLSVFLCFIPFVILLAFIKTPWFKGLFGETIVNLSLKIFLSSNEYHLIRNIILASDEGTTQIDHIIVSKYGIFVVETKNMKGWIFGRPEQKMWMQRIYSFTDHFQNPLHQNYKHLKTLESVLGISLDKFHSLIIFVGNSIFKTAMPKNVTNGGGYIRFIKSKKNLLLDEEEVKTIIDKIQSSRVEPSFKAQIDHVKYVKEMVNQKRNIKNMYPP
jgi:restriction system protein